MRKYMNKSLIQNYRGDGSSQKKEKFDFKCFTKNTICSLNDVECFLNNFTYYYKFFRLYKILK